MTLECELEEEAVILAAKYSIPIYKAKMLLYLAASKTAGQCDKRKEVLKAHITKMLLSMGKYAVVGTIPGDDANVAVARIYEQHEQRIDHDLARSLLSADDYNRVFTSPFGKRFTVTAMPSISGTKCAQDTEEYWAKKIATDDQLHSLLKASLRSSSKEKK